MSSEELIDLSNLSVHDLEMACSGIPSEEMKDDPSKEELTTVLRKEQVIHILKQLKLNLSYFNTRISQGHAGSAPSYLVNEYNLLTKASAQKAADMAGWQYEARWRGNYFRHDFYLKGSTQRVFVRE